MRRFFQWPPMGGYFATKPAGEVFPRRGFVQIHTVLISKQSVVTRMLRVGKSGNVPGVAPEEVTFVFILTSDRQTIAEI